MGDLLKENIPVRGAIAFGDFFRSSSVGESVFVAGRAVIDAYQFEQLQNWVGIMVAPSAVESVPDLEARCITKKSEEYEDLLPFHEVEPRLQWAAFVQRCRQIPFRGTAMQPETFDGFAVVPTSGEAEPSALRDSIKAAIDRLSWLRTIAPSPSAQRKYDQTIAWLSRIQVTWRRFAVALKSS